MRTLVTGGLGFVGSNLVDILIKSGDEVFILDDLSSESSFIENKNEKANLVSCLNGFKYNKRFHLCV